VDWAFVICVSLIKYCWVNGCGGLLRKRKRFGGYLNGGWCFKEVEGPFGVGVWKHIRQGWGVFSSYLSFDVEDGSFISFWHDVWCDTQSLKDVFSDLFCIVRCKEVRVLDNMQISNGVLLWNVSFS
jgi:hypothetical protein